MKARKGPGFDELVAIGEQVLPVHLARGPHTAMGAIIRSAAVMALAETDPLRRNIEDLRHELHVATIRLYIAGLIICVALAVLFSRGAT